MIGRGAPCRPAMPRNGATVRGRQGGNGECVPLGRTPRHESRGGAPTVPCALTMRAADVTMVAAPSLWPRRSHYGPGVVTMAPASSLWPRRRHYGRGVVTMAAAQSLWPRRSHYEGGAVTVTTSAHRPIGGRLHIIDRLTTRRDSPPAQRERDDSLWSTISEPPVS